MRAAHFNSCIIQFFCSLHMYYLVSSISFVNCKGKSCRVEILEKHFLLAFTYWNLDRKILLFVSAVRLDYLTFSILEFLLNNYVFLYFFFEDVRFSIYFRSC